jgi:hypothetical protein
MVTYSMVIGAGRVSARVEVIGDMTRLYRGSQEVAKGRL